MHYYSLQCIAPPAPAAASSRSRLLTWLLCATALELCLVSYRAILGSCLYVAFMRKQGLVAILQYRLSTLYRQSSGPERVIEGVACAALTMMLIAELQPLMLIESDDPGLDPANNQLMVMSPIKLLLLLLWRRGVRSHTDLQLRASSYHMIKS